MIEPIFLHPSADLKHVVSNYLFLISNNPADFYHDTFIPNGNVGLVLNSDERVKVIDQDYVESCPKRFFVTPMKKSLIIEISPPLDSIIVMFNAPAFSRIFDIDLCQLSGPFSDIGNMSPVNIPEDIHGIKSLPKRVEMIEDFIRSRMNGPYMKDDIDDIYLDILQNGTTLPILEIVHNTNLNDRSFRRRFSKRVGISAKMLSRIVRVNYLWNQIIHHRDMDLLDLAFKGGFYDQAHFINDFRKIVGETPRTFFSRNLHEVEIISGNPSRVSL
jgi:AraC-like DNA-binding protein